jgi:hypothetical protein
MECLFVSTARQRQSLTASSTARNLAATSPQKCCEKVLLEGNVASKAFGISQKYAASEVWSRPHILWLQVHDLQWTWLEGWCVSLRWCREPRGRNETKVFFHLETAGETEEMLFHGVALFGGQLRDEHGRGRIRGVEFARSNQVTQVFVAPLRVGLKERLLGRNFVENIV